MKGSKGDRVVYPQRTRCRTPVMVTVDDTYASVECLQENTIRRPPVAQGSFLATRATGCLCCCEMRAGETASTDTENAWTRIPAI